MVVLRYFLCAAVLGAAAAAETPEEVTARIMEQFDTDRSGDWDKMEHMRFFATLKHNDAELTEPKVFKMTDMNGDERISAGEFGVQVARSMISEEADMKDPVQRRRALEQMFPADQPTVEYQGADGETHTMERAAMIERMMEQEELAGQLGVKGMSGMPSVEGMAKDAGFERDEDGNMLKEDKGTLKMDELREKNPGLAKFTKIGQFAHDQLRESGYAIGNLSQLVTSPREPLPHDKPDRAKGTWSKLVIFTVNQQKESADGAKVRVFTAKYEAEIEYDPSKHRPPGLRVISAWRVDKKTDERVEELLLLDEEDDMPSPLMQTWETKIAPMVFNIAGVAICVAIVKTIRTGAPRAHTPRARARARLPPAFPSPALTPARAFLAPSRAVLMRYLGLDDDVPKAEPAAQSAGADAAQAKQEKLEAKKASKAEIKAAGGNPKKKGKAD